MKNVELWCNNEKIFASNISNFSFEQTRMLNSFTDFDYWQRSKSFYMKSFIEPGNKLSIVEAKDKGYITIDEEKEYILQYKLEDLHGNKSAYSFTIVGEKQSIPLPHPTSQSMKWDKDNYYITENFSLTIPKYALYANIGFSLAKDTSNMYISEKYTPSDKFVPLHTSAQMSIRILNDTLSNKHQYGLVLVGNKNDQWLGGDYSNGIISIAVRELGKTYAVAYDNETPIITPIHPGKWVTQKKITIKATDNLSGVKSYRGTIDGKYALFEYDGKSTNHTYVLDTNRLVKGKTHELEFVATDACGNASRYNYEFYY